jgi:hypothetical protein
MDSALLQNLIAGAGSRSQFIGGLVVALLYVVIGLLGAIGSILIFRRIFQGRWEQIFWTFFLVVIAAFYLSFAAYFEASTTREMKPALQNFYPVPSAPELREAGLGAD